MADYVSFLHNWPLPQLPRCIPAPSEVQGTLFLKPLSTLIVWHIYQYVLHAHGGWYRGIKCMIHTYLPINVWWHKKPNPKQHPSPNLVLYTGPNTLKHRKPLPKSLPNPYINVQPAWRVWHVYQYNDAHLYSDVTPPQLSVRAGMTYSSSYSWMHTNIFITILFQSLVYIWEYYSCQASWM